MLFVFEIDDSGTGDLTDDKLTGDEKAWRLFFPDFEGVATVDTDGTRIITPSTTMVEVHEKVLRSSGKKRQRFEWVHRGSYNMYF